jgi:hypothetical protein
MNDEHKPSASENNQIDVSDAWQVLWWCRVFNITKSQLESAVAAVGNEPEDVRRFIARSPQRKREP